MKQGERITTVIAPLDGTAAAMSAMPVARTMATLAGATLRLVHVVEQAEPAGRIEARVAAGVEDLRGAVVDRLAGTPAPAIVRAASEREGTLIVMCAYTGPRTPPRGLGSVAEAVLLDGRHPVLLVQATRGNRPWQLRRVLLPQDGTPTTARALGPSITLTERAGAELVVLHVAAPGVVPSAEPGSLGAPTYQDQPQHEWPAWRREFLHRVRCLCSLPLRARLELALAQGDPGAEIVRFAAQREADLIVMSWRGSLEPRRAAALKTVIIEAPCPVLVLPHQD
ncbi:MAG: universal stress protein [Deltaproteobacteria bacterium]|nr:universal stress protein [Deltaproteobacteria bacterium]